ncbi:50S ribosomal protein L29 [Candidatus Woesearchaeota archaeon]|nr:50S ribosomal protein L29 [Candidatus Woesearchaeota archaeon]
MSKKRIKELKELSRPDLEKHLAEARKELMKANAQIGSGTGFRNPGQIKQFKRSIARIRTLMSQRNKSKVIQKQ